MTIVHQVIRRTTVVVPRLAEAACERYSRSVVPCRVHWSNSSFSINRRYRCATSSPASSTWSENADHDGIRTQRNSSPCTSDMNRKLSDPSGLHYSYRACPRQRAHDVDSSTSHVGFLFLTTMQFGKKVLHWLCVCGQVTHGKEAHQELHVLATTESGSWFPSMLLQLSYRFISSRNLTNLPWYGHNYGSPGSPREYRLY